MNDLMSLGVHRLWKREFVARLAPKGGERILDLAGGTGDIAFRLHAATPHVTVCDINPSMLREGMRRAEDRGLTQGLRWICGNAEALPFPDRSFDAVTIAFGLRNVTHIDRALGEIRRVLVPGGRFFCLEFSRVALPGLAELYDQWSFRAIPRLGALVTGDAASYQYLVESIRQFPAQVQLVALLRAAGFGRPRYGNLSGGIVAIHSGIRL
jgi:demethylmenaquinone methyltransferase/2-methoxy-6-polyprenyl-1,4-benzoquinol methylase